MIRTLRLALVASVLLAPLSITALVIGASPASAGTQGIGVVIPGGSDGVKSFGTKVGRPMKFAGAYLPQDSWGAMIESAAGIGRSWSGDGYRMSVGVPLLPSGASLSSCASGSYNSNFQKIGQGFANNGLSNAVLRLGWEFDGDWFRWSARGNTSTFKSCFQKAVTALRSASGENFLIDWNTTNSGQNLESMWPGDSYVDVIGVDLYDMSFGSSQKTPTDRWSQMYNKSYGLKWLTTFAKNKGKPLSMPEWGVSTRHISGATPDNPYFIEQVYNLLKNNNVLYFNYFEYTTSEGVYAISGGKFPKAWARFKELFSTATGTPSTSPTTNPPPATSPPTTSPGSPPSGSGKRVTTGLEVLYNFEEGSGATVNDRSGNTPINLKIGDTGNVTWTDGGLRLNSSTVLSSGTGAAKRLRDAVASSNAVTIEAWVKASSATQERARIISMSSDANTRNLLVGQGRWGDQADNVYDFRFRTSSTGDGGQDGIVTNGGTATTGLTHLVFSRSTGNNAFVYINGKMVEKVPTGGELDAWNGAYALMLGNEATGDRPWLGEYELVAIYDRYLTSTEVTQNYNAGPDAA